MGGMEVANAFSELNDPEVLKVCIPGCETLEKLSDNEFQAVATNMTVVTTVRTYLFELSPLYGASPQMAYTVRFTYPGGQPESVADEAPGEIAGRYRVSGAKAIRPSFAGVFAENRSAPP